MSNFKLMGQLIDGKLIAEKIKTKTAEHVAVLKEKGITPKLAVILVGEDKPSQTYVRKKGQAAEKVGMEFALYELPGNITEVDLIAKINEIQADPNLSGIIVQLPLPEHLYTTNILNAIKPELDVDCLTDTNLGKLVMKTNTIVPPTPGAVLSILHDLNVDLIGKNVTIIGMGALVGKPLAIMMANERASVMTCNSKTTDTKEKCLMSDIIVTGVGRKNILRGDMVKQDAIVIDTGVSFTDPSANSRQVSKMSGDVNVDEVTEKASFVTPTPGGVGPITVARLLWNTIILAERRYDANIQTVSNIHNYQFTNNDDKTKLIYPELSYIINGILFKTHNELGKYCNEQQVCDKIEQLLNEEGIKYKRELRLSASFEGEKNRNRIDFIIDDKIILEIKCKRYIGRDEYLQTQRYLHAYNKKLGILVNFRDERIIPKRVLNSEYDKK